MGAGWTEGASGGGCSLITESPQEDKLVFQMCGLVGKKNVPLHSVHSFFFFFPFEVVIYTQ